MKLWTLVFAALVVGVDAYAVQATRDKPACVQDYDPVCAAKDGKRRNFDNHCLAEEAGATRIRVGLCGSKRRKAR
jgi:hypothetical protein